MNVNFPLPSWVSLDEEEKKKNDSFTFTVTRFTLANYTVKGKEKKSQWKVFHINLLFFFFLCRLFFSFFMHCFTPVTIQVHLLSHCGDERDSATVDFTIWLRFNLHSLCQACSEPLQLRRGEEKLSARKLQDTKRERRRRRRSSLGLSLNSIDWQAESSCSCIPPHAHPV